MATLSGVLSRYVVEDYVTGGYVEGQPIEITSTVTATPDRILGSGSIVSVTTSTTTVGSEKSGLDNIVYSWDDTGSGRYSWDNWWLTDRTWEQRGVILRSESSMNTIAGKKKLGESLVFGSADVDTKGAKTTSSISFIDAVTTSTVKGGILFDAQGGITGETSIVALGGFLRSASATLNVTNTVTVAGVTQISGNVTLTNVSSVEVDGSISFAGNITIPGNCVVEASAIKLLTGGASIDLGTVVVVVGSSTPIADPFRTAIVDSETRKLNVTEESRKNIVASETRIIIIPEETRTFTIQEETRKIKVPVPPFVSNNIRSN